MACGPAYYANLTNSMPKPIAKIVILAMIGFAIGNAQCAVSCSAGICPLPTPDPPCHRHQPAKPDCAHPTLAVAEHVSSAVPQTLAVAGEVADPTEMAPATSAQTTPAEVWSPPIPERPSLTILRI